MEILENVKMSDYTTFRTGGVAKRLVKIETIEELTEVIARCESDHENYYVLGNGSNVLVSDAGYPGTILLIGNKFSKVTVNEDEIYAEAGVLLSKLSSIAKEASLTGLEFASGIPGTLGGAIYMNAGAYGGEMKFVVSYVDVIKEGTVQRIPAEKMEFGYRKSLAMKEGLIVVGAGIKLTKGNKAEIEAVMKDMASRRIEKQPLEYPSAGSTFKRPEGYFAGKLIEDSGLKGYRVGGAAVSEKHAGFVINCDKAICTSSHVYQLIKDVQKIVKEKQGVDLVPEVRFIGEFEE